MNVIIPTKTSGEIYKGSVQPASRLDVFPGAFFDWHQLIKDGEYLIYKLTVRGNTDTQALIAYRQEKGFFRVKALEKRDYKNPDNLLLITGPLLAYVAHQCTSIEDEPFILVETKTTPQVLDNYKAFGGELHYAPEPAMVFDPFACIQLIELYLRKGVNADD
ncbi:hypothetical protein HUG15_19935 [Salicibibacter cibarius]|uniref:Uncharacterized protein n=1 Tax=Salicibibacter cibarius TaxID=2743000 RepID=A0A7T6Z6D4_9BACI|nr:hypothetical protein [Salicibibacter cibarius]QQK77631.1 hypothetical protein HUG15_19935 [Salicibibacter cibarius]